MDISYFLALLLIRARRLDDLITEMCSLLFIKLWSRLYKFREKKYQLVYLLSCDLEKMVPTLKFNQPKTLKKLLNHNWMLFLSGGVGNYFLVIYYKNRLEIEHKNLYNMKIICI